LKKKHWQPKCEKENCLYTVGTTKRGERGKEGATSVGAMRKKKTSGRASLTGPDAVRKKKRKKKLTFAAEAGKKKKGKRLPTVPRKKTRPLQILPDQKKKRVAHPGLMEGKGGEGEIMPSPLYGGPRKRSGVSVV